MFWSQFVLNPNIEEILQHSSVYLLLELRQPLQLELARNYPPVRTKLPMVQARFRDIRMETAQKILLFLTPKKLLPLFADVIQHRKYSCSKFLADILQKLRRIIITVSAIGLHNIILGR